MKNLTNGLPTIHPGEFLHEILDGLGLTQAAFAHTIGISPMRVSHLLKANALSRQSLRCAWGAHWGKRLTI